MASESLPAWLTCRYSFWPAYCPCLSQSSATQAVTLSCTAGNSDHLDSLSTWLASHSSAAAGVTSICVTCLPSFQEVPKPQLQLPFHRLQGLESLVLSCLAVTVTPRLKIVCETNNPDPDSVSDDPPAATAAPAPAPAAAAAAGADLSALQSLTYLDLGQCTIQLQGLSALTGLQRLAWADSYAEARADPASYDSNWRALCQALPHLRSLAHATLKGPLVNKDTVAVLLSLTALQELHLCGEFCPVTLDQLPQSLTQLLLEHQPEANFPVSFHNLAPLSMSSAEGLLQLTALQELTVRSVLVSTHHLAHLTTLQHLDLLNATMTLAPAGQSLSVLAGLTRLQCVALPQLTAPPFELLLMTGQADLAAVTASSQPTYLNIANGFHTNDQHVRLFPAGRQLPHLLELHVSLGMVCDGVSAAAVAAACPNLQRLHLHPNAAGPVQEAAQEAEAHDLCALLFSLQQLQHLSFLCLNAEFMTVSPPVWLALGCLTDLRHLEVDLMYLEHLCGFMHLHM